MKENGANNKGSGLIQEAAFYSVILSLPGNYLFSSARESRHVSNSTGKCEAQSCILCVLGGFMSDDEIQEQNGYQDICCWSFKRNRKNECIEQ